MLALLQRGLVRRHLCLKARDLHDVRWRRVCAACKLRGRRLCCEDDACARERGGGGWGVEGTREKRKKRKREMGVGGHGEKEREREEEREGDRKCTDRVSGWPS